MAVLKSAVTGYLLLLLTGWLHLAAAQLYGINYAPVYEYEICGTSQEVVDDFTILKQYTNRIRTYGLTKCDQGENILKAAVATGMKVALGVWINNDEDVNANELYELSRLLDPTKFNYYKQVDAVVVGSETQFRYEITLATLQAKISDARLRLNTLGLNSMQIWTAEAFNSVFEFPAIFNLTKVDRLLVHIYPFFGGAPANTASDTFQDMLGQIVGTAKTTGIQIGIGEVGWPSQGGPTVQGAFSSEPNMVTFLKSMLPVLNKTDLPWYWFVSNDSPNHETTDVEAHWGLLYVDRRTPKPGVNAVLQAFYPKLSLSVPPYPPPPPFVGARRYIGCFDDNYTNPGFPFRLAYNVKSVAECELLARQQGPEAGLTYIGLEYYSECWAGRTTPQLFNNRNRIAVGNCSVTCSSPTTATVTDGPECGIGNALATYQLLPYQLTDNPPPPPPKSPRPSPRPPSPPPPPPKSAASHVGCGGLLVLGAVFAVLLLQNVQL